MRTKIKQLKTIEQGRPSLVGSEVTIKGWVRTVRNQKSFAFIEVNDGSTLSNFQVLVNADYPKYEQLIASLSTGVAVSAKGTVVESPGKNQELELHASELVIIGECDPGSLSTTEKTALVRVSAHYRAPETPDEHYRRCCESAQCPGICYA